MTLPVFTSLRGYRSSWLRGDLTGLFEDLPEATLAAVVIAALIELVDFPALATLYRASSARLGQIYGLAARADFPAAVAAMLGVLIFDTLR